MARAAPALSEVATPSKRAQDDERKWKAEDGLRTLTRAAEIKRDKALMADIEAMAKKQAKTLAEIVGDDSTTE